MDIEDGQRGKQQAAIATRAITIARQDPEPSKWTKLWWCIGSTRRSKVWALLVALPKHKLMKWQCRRSAETPGRYLTYRLFVLPMLCFLLRLPNIAPYHTLSPRRNFSSPCMLDPYSTEVAPSCALSLSDRFASICGGTASVRSMTIVNGIVPILIITLRVVWSTEGYGHG